MVDMKSLGEAIRQFRKVKGLTQEELAKKSNLSTMSIRRYENGERLISEKALSRIADALDIAAYEFFPEGEEVDKSRFPWWPLHPPRRLTDSEAQKAGFLQFHSDDDRIAHFYSLLNIDGKLVASKYFFQHLDEETKGIVADYVQHLSEIPQYQRQDAPQSPPAPPEGTDTTPPEKPPESQ